MFGRFIDFLLKSFGLVIPVFFVLNGCAGSLPETLFEKDGVSFVSPEGWKIIDRRIIKDTGYHVSCQRKGFGSGGIFMASWIYGITELDSCIRMYMNEFEKNILMKAATVEFEETVDSVFNDMPCNVSVYKATILGVESRGEIISFYCGGMTFMLVFQESVDESGLNKKGFEKIKSTFLCHPDN
ncbi:MAG: hypothetical protein JW723_02175 [Bacteroidales bacterium]|nr:hypothetical protein [Bacteroidales bacterium]